MELTEEERARWLEFKQKYVSCKEKDKTDRIDKIIRLSKEKTPLNTIQKEVGGSFEFITETRRKGRKGGLING